MQPKDLGKDSLLEAMLSSEYIIGLVDGEGSFTVYIRNPDEVLNVRRRVKVEPKFCVKLIEKDKKILYELQQFFGCGKIYFQKDSRLNHQNCYRYEVFNRNDLKTIIIPFFRKNRLRLVSKQHDFRLFSKLVEQISQGKHHTKNGLRRMYRMKQRMH